ncbi:MAG: carboxypeptidase-like regulatory domain-containing protein [Bryobacteraceae bacterium]
MHSFKYLIGVLILPLALLVTVGFPAAGTESSGGTRSVEGKVYDSAGKIVIGAVVQIKDLKSLQIRSFITQSDGGYRFLGLSTEADYQLSASYAGASSKPRTLTVFDSHKKAVVDLKLR